MATTETTYTAIVDGSGNATITFKVSNGLDTYQVTQVSIEMTNAPSGSTCELRKNGYAVSPLIPTMDTAAGDPPVQLRPADLLTIEWTGCTPGAVARAIVFYDDGRTE